MPGIARCPQHSRSHVVNHVGNHAERENPKIQSGIRERILRGIHPDQRLRSQEEADQCQDDTARKSERHRCMNGPFHVIRALCAVVLRNDHRRARGHADKEPHEQIDQRRRRAADGGQSLRAHKAPYNHGVHRVVQRLEKRTQQKREEKQQQLFPDHSLRDCVVIVRFPILFCHFHRCHFCFIPCRCRHPAADSGLSGAAPAQDRGAALHSDARRAMVTVALS